MISNDESNPPMLTVVFYFQIRCQLFSYIKIWNAVFSNWQEDDCYSRDELFSASCQLVCEWAEKLLERAFSGLRELSEFLVSNSYVNSKSMAAFTVSAAMQEAGILNSSGKLVALSLTNSFTCILLGLNPLDRKS